ncbi:MAG: TrmH family RNA methyltransferase [Saprospiraceae bacterium]|nr:TrmH family RNA methyltransferase [Saprospiraceae bacterium]
MGRRPLQFEDIRPDFEQYNKFIQANRFPISLLLDGVDDVRNVGAIFRLADGARLEKIYTYNSKIIRIDKQLRRVSRATEQFVPYEHLPDLAALQALKVIKPLIGLEWTNDSILYTEYQIPKEGCILVLGNEECGISQEVLNLLDTCVHIPMYGVKTSLNVAVAAGIVMYDFLNRMNN